jgi:spore germination protein KA
MKAYRSYRSALIEKRSKLDYKYIENNQTWDLITRTCKDPLGKISGGMRNLLDIVGIVINIGSLIIILMTQVWWAALVILLVTIPLLILAGIFGFMGIIIGLMFGLAYLVSLRSFGVPYFSPVSPAQKEGWKDVFIRAPWWAMKTRPAGLDIENKQRANSGNFAKPPQKKGEDEN